MNKKLRDFFDLPPSQQRALEVILKVKKEAFHSSDVQDKIATKTGGKGAGAVLGALYRNGYLQKVSGGRDKMWKLSEETQKTKTELQKKLTEIKKYWNKNDHKP